MMNLLVSLLQYVTISNTSGLPGLQTWLLIFRQKKKKIKEQNKTKKLFKLFTIWADALHNMCTLAAWPHNQYTSVVGYISPYMHVLNYLYKWMCLLLYVFSPCFFQAGLGTLSFPFPHSSIKLFKWDFFDILQSVFEHSKQHRNWMEW